MDSESRRRRLDLSLAELRALLALLGDEPEPDPMLPRLLEMYRDWCRSRGVTPSID